MHDGRLFANWLDGAYHTALSSSSAQEADAWIRESVRLVRLYALFGIPLILATTSRPTVSSSTSCS